MSRASGEAPARQATASGSADVVLELRNVSRIYRMGEVEVRALDGVSLAVPRGSFVAIMGPSGSGKTTLLHLMGALDRPSGGTVRVDGVDVATLDDAALARLRGRRIGFIFQAYNLYPTLSARGNVELPMALAERPRPARRTRSDALLARVGMADRAGHLPNQLSGGQRQRAAVARALANDPAYVLADEPTGNLDSRSGEEVLALLDELHAERRTLVVVTHNPDIARRAERLVRLRDGRIEADGPPAELLGSEVAA